MMLSDKAIEFLETQIPYLAEQATRQAYWDTLASGNSVLIAVEGQIMEVFPDGSRKFVKQITKPSKVKKRTYTIPRK